MQPFGERQSCNEGKIKTWGADHCRLAAPKGYVKVPQPSKLQTGEDPVTKEMRKSVCMADSVYKARLGEEKEEKKKELEKY